MIAIYCFLYKILTFLNVSFLVKMVKLVPTISFLSGLLSIHGKFKGTNSHLAFPTPIGL